MLVKRLAVAFKPAVPGRFKQAVHRVGRIRARRRSMRAFDASFAEFARRSRESGSTLPVRWEDRRALLNDAGRVQPFDRHYVYHAAWAARVIAEQRPDVHVDIGSTLLFAGIVSAFTRVEYYDYRRTELELENLISGEADLTDLHFADRSIASLSCMHTVEHVGLGRYGDELDPEGDRKAMGELQRVLAPGGSLLFVVPVGVPRVVFNAHRTYGYADVLAGFPELELVEFALIPNSPSHGHLIRGADPRVLADRWYDCGCFHFRRLL